MPTPKQHRNNAARQRAYRERRKRATTSMNGLGPPPKESPIPTMPSVARWTAIRRIAEQSLETLANEMQGYRDDRSESWQEGSKGEAFQETLDQVEEALQAVRDIEMTGKA